MIALKDVLGDQLTAENYQAWSLGILSLAEILIEKENDLKYEYKKRAGGWVGERKFILQRKEEVVRDIMQFDFVAADGYKGAFDFTAG